MAIMNAANALIITFFHYRLLRFLWSHFRSLCVVRLDCACLLDTSVMLIAQRENKQFFLEAEDCCSIMFVYSRSGWRWGVSVKSQGGSRCFNYTLLTPFAFLSTSLHSLKLSFRDEPKDWYWSVRVPRTMSFATLRPAISRMRQRGCCFVVSTPLLIYRSAILEELRTVKRCQVSRLMGRRSRSMAKTQCWHSCLSLSVTLEELGVQYTAHNIDISTGSQKEEWFLKINRGLNRCLCFNQSENWQWKQQMDVFQLSSTKRPVNRSESLRELLSSCISVRSMTKIIRLALLMIAMSIGYVSWKTCDKQLLSRK